MANFKEQPGWCAHCNRQVLGRKQEAAHIFWLIATLFSCGFLVIFWFFDILAKNSKPFLCSQCGSALGSRPATASQPVLNPTIQKLAAQTGQFQPAYLPNNINNYPASESKRRKCLSCGFVNFADASFCKKCGNSVS